MPNNTSNKITSKKIEINIRSEEVQEILSYVPIWMIRWGITLIFGIFILLIFISWFIKYPDIVSGEVIITTETPPVKIVTLASGNIQELFLADNTKVEVGDKIAEIETGIDPENIDFLRSILIAVDSFLVDSKTDLFPSLDTNVVLGVMQLDYNTLISSVKECKLLLEDTYHSKNVASLKKQIEAYKRLSYISKKELKLTEKELSNAIEKYEADKELYQEKVLAKLEFKAQETIYLQVEKSVERDKKALVQTDITIVQLEKQLNELIYRASEKERQLLESIISTTRTLKNAINTWKHTQVLSAPIDGELSYLKMLNKNQFLKENEAVFVIIPDDEKYTGYINIPVRGAGKVKEHQKVRVKLNNYPYHEYGQVDGVVEQISLVAADNYYRVKIALPNKLLSSYDIQLSFRPEMSGTAEIITDDLRLMERVFNNFKKLLDTE